MAPSAGARGLNLVDWNVQLRVNPHTHTHVRAHVCHHTAEYVRTVELCGSVTGVCDAAVVVSLPACLPSSFLSNLSLPSHFRCLHLGGRLPPQR